MANILRKTALPATIAFFSLLIGLNAFVTWRNLKSIQTYAAQRLDASDTQSAVVAVELDLQAIETGQRGYLLTGDPAYLAPFTQAVQDLPLHFSALRSRLATRSAKERSIQAELETVAASKIADADETIRLRQKGYRHRAFLIVDSNRGKDLMDHARSLLERLSAVETANIADYDRRWQTGAITALEEFALGSVVLLALTVVTLIAFDRQGKRLQRAYDRQAEQLRASTRELERITSIVSDDVRGVATQIRSYAESLLNAYGGFLPRQGQERAAWIYEGSCQINRVLDRLLARAGSGDESSADKTAQPPVEIITSKERPTSQTA